jgi:hypothetical protein
VPSARPLDGDIREMQQAIRDVNRRSAEIVDLTTPPPARRAPYHPVHGAPHPAQFYGGRR